MEVFMLGLIWYSVFLLSTTLHEAAHALAAKLLGDETAYFAGQVTLDPLPHIHREPIGTILVPFVSFLWSHYTWMLGWASAPYNPAWAQRYPRRSAYMALAGPLANLLLVFIAVAFIHLGIYLDVFFAPNQIVFDSVVGAYSEGAPATFATLLSIMFILNLVLFVFNLLPLPPLDGSSLFPLFMNESLALKIMGFLNQPGLGLIGLILAWFMFDDVFGPVYNLAINLLYPGLSYR